MANLSQISNITTAANALGNLVLVTPQSVTGYQPQGVDSNGDITLSPDLPAILFHYEGEQTAMLDSDITDHYIEDNTAIQDQIALKPVIITTNGYIGELNDVPPPALKILQAAANRLTTIGSYIPQLTISAQIAYNEAFAAYQLGSNLINAGVSAWSSITGSGGVSVIDEEGDLNSESLQNKQQTAFQQFYGYWQSRTLFTVQTPWAVFQNMAIKSLRAIQDAETNVISNFEVSFKQIRIASSVYRVIPPVLSSRASTAAVGAVNQGPTAGTPSISVAQGVSQTVGVA